MHIGLIGGIGVGATLAYYARLTARLRAEGAPLDLTIVHGDVDELVRNNLADRRDAQVEAFLPLLERLARAGCDAAALTSLGAHFCFEELAARAPLPLVSAVAPLDAAFAAQGLRCVGLLGTRVVMRSRLYGQLKQTEALAPDDQIEEIGQLYQDLAVSGLCPDETRAAFFAAGAAMVARGAEAIVLAGTDLTLAFGGQDPGYPVIDALDIHVARLAELALGRATL